MDYYNDPWNNLIKFNIEFYSDDFRDDFIKSRGKNFIVWKPKNN